MLIVNIFMEVFEMDISERIKKLRESLNITSNDLAELTGIHPVSIRKYETKKMVPGIEIIDKMCDSLKLPRMVFEGIHEQYTDYNYVGDFYQLLFLLMANGTIDHLSKDNLDSYKSYKINQNLSKYIQIKNGDQIIPLDNISFNLNMEEKVIRDTFYKLALYFDSMNNANAALESKKWNDKSKGESKEEYASRMKEQAEKLQLELILSGHGWESYMSGIKNTEEALNELHEFILKGGNYYDFIMKANLPEAMKIKYIESYEDAFVSEIVESQNDPYPGNASPEEKDKWIESILEQKEQYKLNHPDYKEKAKKHALEEAESIRKNAK